MKKLTLIVISGLAATGKTTLAKFLSEKLELPLFAKDQFKEPMYDFIGFPNSKEEHGKLGGLSHHFVNEVTRELLSRSISHIVEAPFGNEVYSPFLIEMKKKFDVRVIQVQLECDGQILQERFLKRQRDGGIHAGHQGIKFYDLIKDRLAVGKMEHLEIESPKIVIDTTNFSDVSYEDILNQVDSILNS